MKLSGSTVKRFTCPICRVAVRPIFMSASGRNRLGYVRTYRCPNCSDTFTTVEMVKAADVRLPTLLWSNFPVRVRRRGRRTPVCLVCKKEIEVGERYRDRHHRRFAHLACARRADLASNT